MPSFDDLFDTSEERPISYQGKTLYRAHQIEIPEKCVVVVRFVSTNSEWRQGIALNVNGHFTFAGNRLGKKLILWEDTATKDTTLDIASKDGVLWAYNTWDYGDGAIQSWRFGAAMIIEDIPNGKRYYCNDGHPDDDFDDLVFEVTVLPENQGDS